MSKWYLKAVFTLCLCSVITDGGFFSSAQAYELKTRSSFSESLKLRCERALLSVKNALTSDTHSRVERIVHFGTKNQWDASYQERQFRAETAKKMLRKMAPAIEDTLKKEGLLHPTKRDLAKGFILDRKAVEKTHPLIAKIVPPEFDISMSPLVDSTGQRMGVNNLFKFVMFSHKHLYEANNFRGNFSLIHEMVHVDLHAERVRNGHDRWGLIYQTKNRT